MNPVLLLVDDDDAIRTQMKWALSAHYEIVSAEDRGGAIEMFKKKKPAVTLLDLGLPPRPNEPVEGLAALAELKALDDMAKGDHGMPFDEFDREFRKRHNLPA